MNTVERFRAVYTGQPVDRVPVCGWLGLPLLCRYWNRTCKDLLRSVVQNPLEVIQLQEELGMDPILVTVDDRWFSIYRYWRLLYNYTPEALETWQVKEKIKTLRPGVKLYHFTATTPEGDLTWSMKVGEYQVAEVENAIKDERDLDLAIKYMPDPGALNIDNLTDMVQRTGDRAFSMLNFIGVWGEAANMRSLVTLCTDLLDTPDFVKKLSEFLMQRAIKRIRRLAESGIHSILYDQSWVGIGFSPGQYSEFMLPYDKQVVEAAHEAGVLVSFHNCGCGMPILDHMISAGSDALETLTPPENSGDFVLKDVKERVGNRITLNGGFNERIFSRGSPEQVRAQTKKCLDDAMAGGRYILRTCGQIFDTDNKCAAQTDRTLENIKVWTETARQLGQYG